MDSDKRSEELKARLRSEFLKRRNEIPEDRRCSLSNRIVQQVLARGEVARARHVMCYVAVRGEVNTEELIRRCLAEKKRVSVPLCDRSSGVINAAEISDFDCDLVPGTYGIPEPCLSRARVVDIAEVDLFIVPGVGFDLCGVRLGWGKGYYDAFLAGAEAGAMKIGLAYEEQLLPQIACSRSDVLVEMIVTEDRVIDCRKIRSCISL